MEEREKEEGEGGGEDRNEKEKREEKGGEEDVHIIHLHLETIGPQTCNVYLTNYNTLRASLGSSYS